MQLAWSMPTDTDATGFHLLASADGVNFTPFATITNASTRAFTATGLDAHTNYSFCLDAYNDPDDSGTDSDYAYTSTAATTDDAWEDVDQVTPGLAYDQDGHHPISWFTPLDGQGDGQYFNPGLYQLQYAGGAYNMGPDSWGWCTGAYFYHVEDPTGYSVQSELRGILSRDSQEEAEHDTYAAGGIASTFGAADEKIGVLFGEYTDPDDPGPGVTWTLQRRIPHAGVIALNDATKEGDTAEDGDDTHLAKLWFWRDDRVTEDLTLHFDLGGSASSDDYTAIAKIPDGDGGFTEESIDLASGTITIPAGTFADPIYGIEVDVTATDDMDPEWTEDLEVSLNDDDETYVADHPNDDGGPYDYPDAVLHLKDNDLSFELEQGTLVANYNDSNNNGITDYDETNSGSDPDLYEMKLHVPRIDKDNAKVFLDLPANFVNVYLSSQKGDPLEPDDPGGSRYTWDGDASQVPDSIWLEVKAGSQSVDDMLCELSTDDNGDAPPPVQQRNTAVNVHINLSGNPNGGPSGDVKNKSIDWLIGQMTDLSATVDAPAAWLQNTTYSWDIPGHVLRQYLISDTNGTAYPLTANDGGVWGNGPSGTQLSQVTYFWASTDAASDDRTVSLHIGNVDGKSYDVQTKFKVYEPTTTMQTTYEGKNAALQGGAGMQLTARKTQNVPDRRANGDLRAGIEITSSVSLPNAFTQTGSWTYLQTATTNRLRKSNTGVWTGWSLNGVADLLDSSVIFPFQFDPANNDASLTGNGLQHVTGNAQFTFFDSPGDDAVPATIVYLGFDELFKTYIMFKAPGDSVWLPTKMIQWNYFAVGERVFADPAVNFGPVMGNGAPISSKGPEPKNPVKVTAPPEWNQRVQDGNWV
jgi:hypothetical protein